MAVSDAEHGVPLAAVHVGLEHQPDTGFHGPFDGRVALLSESLVVVMCMRVDKH